MQSVRRAFACSILFVSLSALLGGCGDRKPTADDFRASIGQAASGYSIKDLRCESFADKSQEGSGRASCRGTLAIDQDLYTSLSTEEIASLLVSAGIPATGTGFFRGRHPKNIYTKTVNAGSETPFAAECTYFGDVDGRRYGCNTNFSRFSGLIMGSIGGDYVLKDSPEYASYLNEVMTDYRKLDAAFKELKGQIDRFFSPGRSVYSPFVRASVTSPLTWSGEPGFLGYPGYFSLETKYQDLRDRTTSTFCGYPKGNPKDDILFAGSIGFRKDRATGEESFTADVQMQDRAIQYQNRYQGCSMHYRWNGTAFKAPYTPAELRSQ